jgi:hypothetical protein
MTIEGAVDTQGFDLFVNALAKAIKMISVDDICGRLAHCGYVFSFI